MNTDRELLEAAAKAYGLYGVDPRGDDDLWETNATDEDGFPKEPTWGMRTIAGTWNPLTNDGDALRLAVKLKVWIRYRDDNTVNACWYDDKGMFAGNVNEGIGSLRNGDEPNAAVRRAIVRAAAAMHPNGGTTR